MQTASFDTGSTGGLGRRYFLNLLSITVGLLLASGLIEAGFGHREALEHVARVQGLQAQAAAAEIEQYLAALQRGIRQVQTLPWGQPGFGPSERRLELHRLMVLQPSIIEIVDADKEGRETLAVSRRARDRVASTQAVAPSAAGFGPAEFDADGSPQVRLTVPGKGQLFANTRVLVNLRFLADVASGLQTPDGGDVYVVDTSNQLIAHADPTQALRQLNVGGTSVVAQARRELATSPQRVVAVDAPGLHGRAALTSAVELPTTRWLLFVEQPRERALAPVVATLQRTLLLIGVAGLAALALSAAFARRLAAPIARLRRATAEMASGQLDQRIDVDTGDEIQGLAQDFNTMSARLLESYRDLEDKVAQRTAELARRRDEADRANAAKTRFLASASHDLRQPMHAIGLLVDVLRSRVTQPDQRALAEKTHQAVRSMETLFGSLLDISKLDAGAVRPQPCPFALQDLLDRVTLSYAPLANAKGLELRVHPTLLAVETDPALLERVLGNLVGNAIRYTRRGGVLVVCRERSGQVALRVIDTGVGIPADRLALAFEEFVRLDDTEPGDKGLGLGLAIVRRTIELLGLGLTVRSTPGRGSRFEVRLPAARHHVASASGTAPAETMPMLHGSFALLVDDDEANLSASAELLRDWGCLVATARSADGALAEADRHLRAPDVIVTDLRLGAGSDGLALIRRLRETADARIPALLVTADIEVAQRLESDVVVLHKPVDAGRLAQALALALRHAHQP